MSRADSPLRDRMIFLVGSRRSGTNWLQRVVAAHPAVASIPSETYLFSRGIAPLRERFHHGIQGSTATGHMHMEEAEMLDALRDFCDRALLPYLLAEPDASRLAERTPEHVAYLDVIGAVYPDAHVVHIVRDGRDVARSLLSQNWASAPKSMTAAAEEWRTSVESADAASRRLEHYVLVRYEELLSDPQRQVRNLFAALGLDASSSILSDVIVEAGIRYNVDPNAPQITTGKWRESLSSEEITEFMRIAGSTLTKLGYATAGGSRPEPEGEAAPEIDEGERKRRRLFGRVGRENGDDFSIRVRERAAEITRLFDRFVSAINTGRTGDLSSLTSRSVDIRVLTPSEDWKGRGGAAVDRLVDTIERDNRAGGRQVRGDLHIAVPTASAVMLLRSADGALALRVIAATFSARDKATRVAYYHHPIAGA